MRSFYSPLRYPGGKNKLAKFVALICERNNINGHYVEPYAGGASVALYLLLNGYVKEVTINDFDKAIYAFWHSILYDTERFCRKIRNTDITIKNWKKFKTIHTNQYRVPLFDLGFATFFLNRTNHSGIIDGGIIGGLDQKGKYKIDCRFNEKELIGRIELIASRREGINLYNLDALELVEKIKKESQSSQTIFYFDPPYYLKGPSLYTSYYTAKDHEKVSSAIKRIKNLRWIVSYDNTPEIKKLYKGFRKLEYPVIHSAHVPRGAEEVVFFDGRLIVPDVKSPVSF